MPFCRIFFMSFRVNTLYIISRQLTRSSFFHYLFNAGASLLTCSTSCEFCLFAVAPLLAWSVFVYFLQQFLSSLSLGHLHLLFVAASFLALARLSSLFFCSSFSLCSCSVIFIFFAAISLFALCLVIFKFVLQQLFCSFVRFQCIFLAATILVLISFSSPLGFSTFFLLQFFYFGSDISISVCSNSACFYEHLLSFHLFIVMLL